MTSRPANLGRTSLPPSFRGSIFRTVSNVLPSRQWSRTRHGTATISDEKRESGFSALIGWTGRAPMYEAGSSQISPTAAGPQITPAERTNGGWRPPSSWSPLRDELSGTTQVVQEKPLTMVGQAITARRRRCPCRKMIRLGCLRSDWRSSDM